VDECKPLPAGAQLAARHQAIFRAILALGVMLTTLAGSYTRSC